MIPLHYADSIQAGLGLGSVSIAHGRWDRPVETLRILHLTNAVGRKSFGVGAVVLQLSIAQRALAADPSIWTNDHRSEAAEVRQDMSVPDGSLATYPVFGPRGFWYSPAMESAATGRQAGGFSVLHQHGVWAACGRSSLRWHDRFGRPVVVAAHGELDSWALRRSRIKKWLALRAYAGPLLRCASCLHAMGENELSAYRDFGLTNPVAMIPNGVSQKWLTERGDAAAFRAQCSLPGDRRLLLYLSRVTPKKGLPLLFQAIAALRKQMEDWLLLIVGPDEFDHTRQLRQLARALGIDRFVRFLGPVFGEQKRNAFAAADVFVLPTHSEGNPIAVLEALGAGVPVLTTRGAPCDYLVARECGWWTEIDAESVREALEDALGWSKARLAAMGERGREVVQNRFTWPRIAKMTLELYSWLLGGVDRPEFVHVN